MTDEEFQFIVERRSSLRDLLPFYRNKDECYVDFARRMNQRYAEPHATCMGCGAGGKLRPVRARWSIEYQNRKSIRDNLLGLVAIPFGQVVAAQAAVAFSTTHGVCRQCRRQMHTRRLLMIVVSLLVRIVAIGAVVASVVVSLLLAVIYFTDDRISNTAVWSLAICSAAALVVWPLKRRIEVLEIPAFLREIGKRPVRLCGLE